MISNTIFATSLIGCVACNVILLRVKRDQTIALVSGISLICTWTAALTMIMGHP